MKRKRVFLLVVLILGSAVWTGPLFAQCDAIEIKNYRFVQNQAFDKITGKAKNTSDTTVSTASIDFAAYNDQGETLATPFAFLEDVDPRKTVTFEARYFADTTPANVKLQSVDCFFDIFGDDQSE